MLSHICSIPFLNRLAIWLDIYTWSRRDPEIIKKVSDALRFSLPQRVGILRI